MATSARCAVCKQQAYRDKSGRMMLHTVQVVGDKYGDPLRAEVCTGSDRGARP